MFESGICMKSFDFSALQLLRNNDYIINKLTSQGMGRDLKDIMITIYLQCIYIEQGIG